MWHFVYILILLVILYFKNYTSLPLQVLLLWIQGISLFTCQLFWLLFAVASAINAINLSVAFWYLCKFLALSQVLRICLASANFSCWSWGCRCLGLWGLCLSGRGLAGPAYFIVISIITPILALHLIGLNLVRSCRLSLSHSCLLFRSRLVAKLSCLITDSLSLCTFAFAFTFPFTLLSRRTGRMFNSLVLELGMVSDLWSVLPETFNSFPAIRQGKSNRAYPAYPVWFAGEATGSSILTT